MATKEKKFKKVIAETKETKETKDNDLSEYIIDDDDKECKEHKEIKHLSMNWFKKPKAGGNGYKYVSKIDDVWAECAFYKEKKPNGKYKMYVKHGGDFIKKHMLLRDRYDTCDDPLLEQMLKEYATIMVQDKLNGKLNI